MKSIKTILAGIVETDCAQQITGLALDSRKVMKGNCFIAYPGVDRDGRDFIQQAIHRGAVAIIHEAGLIHTKENVPHIAVENLNQKVSKIAANYYSDPSKDLDCIAVTGTNGKSSVTHYIAQLFGQLKEKAAVMGTLGNGTLDQLKPSDLTTGDPITVQSELAALKKKGINYVAMEVSSHALHQYRLDAVTFRSAHFTNLSHDHLDYHLTLENYFKAKSRLFEWQTLEYAVMNIGDPFGDKLAKQLKIPVFRYALKSKEADFYIRSLKLLRYGMQLEIMTPQGELNVDTSLMGEFNAINLLAAIAEFHARGYTLSDLAKAIPYIHGVPGRMQTYQKPDFPLVIIDYAHTPDALSNVLDTISQYTDNKLWCVFGCGGDRDRHKRSKMGKVAEHFADHIIICNDNPRTEDPKKIVEDILAGMTNQVKATLILDRAEAIHTALSEASSKDIVLIAGKGHEDYQIIGENRYDFSDLNIVDESYVRLG